MRRPTKSNNYILDGNPEALAKAFREMDCVRYYKEKVNGAARDFFYAVSAVDGTLDALSSRGIALKMVRITSQYSADIRRVNELEKRPKSEDPPYVIETRV